MCEVHAYAIWLQFLPPRVKPRPHGYLYTTMGLGLRHTGLNRASLTQKLARARLRPARFRPANVDHSLGAVFSVHRALTRGPCRFKLVLWSCAKAFTVSSLYALAIF